MPKEDEVYGNISPFSQEGFELFKKWIIDNGVTYYAKPKEDFSMIEAYKMAENEGNNKLLVENLS